MGRSLTIIDADYKNWVKELSQRYRRSQIKAAVKINNEVLKFYWELAENLFSVPWPRHGQREGAARYEFRDSGTK